MLEIIQIVDKKYRKEFVQLPLKMYKGNRYFVPPFYADEMAMFTDKNIYSKMCDHAFFIAKRDGKVVGRIQGIIQNKFNALYNTKQARFCRFDCEDNQETASALFDAVEKWAKSMGADHIIGPSNYSDQEREGLLIEGFNYLSTFEEQYNYPYYQKLIENCGYEKDVDWIENRLFQTNQNKKTLEILAQRALKDYDLRVANVGLSMKEIIKKYAKGIFECLDECYSPLYGYVPFSDEMRNQMIQQFKLVLDKRYFTIIVNKEDKVVACGFCIPGIGKALQKSGGRLTPAAIVRLLKTIKNPESVDLALVGILPEYRKSGVAAFVMQKLQEISEIPSVQYMETNLCLEENTNIWTLWKRFDKIQHKKRRSFIKKFN
jgi:hypothetical protein